MRSIVFCHLQVVFAENSPSKDAAELREFAKCIDGILGEVAGEHKEIEKYHAEYKVLAEKTNLQLDGCLKMDDDESKEE